MNNQDEEFKETLDKIDSELTKKEEILNREELQQNQEALNKSENFIRNLKEGDLYSENQKGILDDYLNTFLDSECMRNCFSGLKVNFHEYFSEKLEGDILNIIKNIEGLWRKIPDDLEYNDPGEIEGYLYNFFLRRYYQFLIVLRELGYALIPLLNSDYVNVLSVGAGPGASLFALIDFFNCFINQYPTEFRYFDLKVSRNELSREWRNFLQEFSSLMERESYFSQQDQLNFNYRFDDFTKYDFMSILKKPPIRSYTTEKGTAEIFTFDIVIFNYFLVSPHRIETVKQNLQNLSYALKNNSIIIIMGSRGQIEDLRDLIEQYFNLNTSCHLLRPADSPRLRIELKSFYGQEIVTSQNDLLDLAKNKLDLKLQGLELNKQYFDRLEEILSQINQEEEIRGLIDGYLDINGNFFKNCKRFELVIKGNIKHQFNIGVEKELKEKLKEEVISYLEKQERDEAKEAYFLSFFTIEESNIIRETLTNLFQEYFDLNDQIKESEDNLKEQIREKMELMQYLEENEEEADLPSEEKEQNEEQRENIFTLYHQILELVENILEQNLEIARCKFGLDIVKDIKAQIKKRKNFERWKIMVYVKKYD